MALDLIIVDSCVFINPFRGNKTAMSELKRIKHRIAYSYNKYMELLAGSRTDVRKKEITELFDSFYGIPLDYSISNTAVELMLKYVSGQRSVSIPDCLIAASQLTTKFPLFTYNKKDFDFVETIQFYN